MVRTLQSIHHFLLGLYRILLDVLSKPLYLLSPPSDDQAGDKPLVIVSPRKPGYIDYKKGINGYEEHPIPISRFVKEKCPSLQTGFRQAWWLDNGHLQTTFSVFGDFTKVDRIEYHRTLLRLPDGGTISLDSSPPRELASKLPEDAPTIIVGHGLTGGSHESYVRNLLEWVVRPKDEGGLGGRGIVVNFRGCAGTPITSPQLYSAGYTGDFHTAVSYISNLYPSSTLIGIGFSLGASVVARYIGEEGDKCVLKAGVVLAAPWDLPAMSDKLEGSWYGRMIYTRAMGKNVARLSQNAMTRFPEAWRAPDSEPADSSRRIFLSGLLEAERALRRKGRKIKLRDADEVITCKIGGMSKELNPEKGVFPLKDAAAYYSWGSACQFIGGIRRPVLAMNAMDDPICDSGHLPVEEVQASSHVVLAVTSKGGHLGWFDGPWRTQTPTATNQRKRHRHQRWIVKPISEFVCAMLDDAIGSPSTELRREVEDGEEQGWEWVKGSEIDTYGRCGWKVVGQGAKIEGAESSGSLQGL